MYPVTIRSFNTCLIDQMPDGYLSAFFIAMNSGLPPDDCELRHVVIDFELKMWSDRRRENSKTKLVYTLPRRAWFYFFDEDIWLAPCFAKEFALELGNLDLSKAIGNQMSTQFVHTMTEGFMKLYGGQKCKMQVCD
jgi:hypothetical protein